MTWDKGFNFRATSGFVGDPANTTYVLAADAYTGSVIRNGVAFGWEDARRATPTATPGSTPVWRV